MTVSYDHAADVLYISFRDGDRRCKYIENDRGQVMRIDAMSGEPVGCTIPMFSRRAAEGDIVITEIDGAVAAGGGSGA